MTMIGRFLTLLAVALITSVAPPSEREAAGFILNNRWVRTATDGSGLGQGDPTTITWGFIPDGTLTPEGTGSNLISFLDNVIGAGTGGSDLTQRPWFPLFEQSFGRWSELSGLSYAYEPNDDQVEHFTTPGVLGVRADVRVGGANIVSRPPSTLAYNSLPANGDMLLDTSEASFYGNSFNNYIRLRNVVMHEHGHGIGLLHVESDTRRFLMEPFIVTSIDGPQLDDLIGAHRAYGDFNEKSNGGAGNEIVADATDLEAIADGETVSIGTDGTSVLVTPDEFDFVSIDDNSDIDFFTFSVSTPSTVDITLTPVGSSYQIGPEDGSQSILDNTVRSNLALALFDTDETTLLSSVDLTGLGESEMISDFSLDSPGDYYVRVTGSHNQVQLYQLDISATAATISADFNGDGSLDCLDVDALVGEISSSGTDLTFDLTGDGLVTTADLDQWLADAGAVNLASGNPYLLGDATLDGFVDTSDFNAWNGSKFTAQPAWCSGDFNADGFVDTLDFNLWNGNKFQSSDHGGACRSQPAALAMTALAALILATACRK